MICILDNQTNLLMYWECKECGKYLGALRVLRISISRNQILKLKGSSFQELVQNWNEITKLRALPEATFKKAIQMILLKILEN